MQPSYSSIGQIFSSPTRYTVPLFQRPYVWTKEDQWQPLWDDVQALADRVLHPPAHKPVAGHFLGTVVLEQVKTTSIAMTQRRVIDGQQRLTTLQLMLKAAEHALVISGAAAPEEATRLIELAAGQVSQLTRNQFAQQPKEAFKVWPTNDDRDAFKGVMESEAKTGIGTQNTRMAEAYTFFRTNIIQWLADDDVGQRALAFVAALKDHLRLIVLDLDDADEPQAIFETLNAHGTPLLPTDLIKNWLLWQANRQELQSTNLYKSYWAKFDSEHLYWRKTIGTGHAARPRVDTFLQNWLIVSTGEAISVKHLYDRFLAYANERATTQPEQLLNVEEMMAEINRFADYYNQIDEPIANTSLHRVLRRLNRLDFVVFRPVLMALMDRNGVESEEVEIGARALESFLVRRMVCDQQTRGYGTLALELVRCVKDVPVDGMASSALIAALISSTGGWPDDATFRQQWVSRRFYGWFRRDRVAMLLQALEEYYQGVGEKSEPILSYDFSKLQIEHVMPQSWTSNWPLIDGYDVLQREVFVQNIGNLTLVSTKLNPALSNNAWFVANSSECKRAQIEQHSSLKLNKFLLNENPMLWNEQGIFKRANALFDVAREIWPTPDSIT